MNQENENYRQNLHMSVGSMNDKKLGELEHLKIKTRLIDEMFVSVMSKYVFLKW